MRPISTDSAETRISIPKSRRATSSATASRIGERQSFSLSAFRNEIDDLIEFVVLDPVTFEGENRNVERARIDGIEAGLELRRRGLGCACHGDPPGSARPDDG